MRFNDAYDPFRSLGAAWQALKRAPLALLVGGVILVLLDGGGGGGGNFGSALKGKGDGVDWERIWPFVVGIGGLCLCVGIVLFVIASWVRIGFANTVEEVLRTGSGDVGKIFEGKGRLLSMVGSRLLCGLIVVASFLPYGFFVLVAAVVTDGFEREGALGALILSGGFVLYLPVIVYVGLGVALADQAVALEGRLAVDSIKRSWSLVSGHRWMLLWFSIVTGVFALLGVCLLCLGIFLTGTLAEVAKSEAFLALTRGEDRRGWWIETQQVPAAAQQGWAPPPPLPPGA